MYKAEPRCAYRGEAQTEGYRRRQNVYDRAKVCIQKGGADMVVSKCVAGPKYVYRGVAQTRGFQGVCSRAERCEQIAAET